MKKRTKIIVLVLLGILGIRFVRPFITIGIKNTNITSEKWEKDIEYLKDQLINKHINVFSNISRNDLEEDFSNLHSNAESMAADEIQLEIMKILSKIGDSHTELRNFITGTDYSYPIELYWFNGGYYLVNTIEEYKELIGSKLVTINDVSAEDVLLKTEGLIPYENLYRLRSEEPSLLRDPRVLKKFNIIEDSKVIFGFENQESQYVQVSMEPDKIKDIDLVENLEGRISLIKRNSSNYFEYLEEKKAIYFNLSESKRRDSVTRNLINEIEDKDVHKLIIDLRHNVGGYYSPNNSLISAIIENEKINKKGNLIVLVGRNTFSSGLSYAIDLRQKTNAIFYGEPTGGKPNRFGDIRFITLPNSKLHLSYSTKYFDKYDEEVDSFYPDTLVELSVEDYLNHVDLVLKKALE